MTDHKEPGVITEQLELMEMYLRDATFSVREQQEMSLFSPCKLKVVGYCFMCRAKQWILRERYK